MPSGEYYGEWHGHRPEHLRHVHDTVRGEQQQRVLWLLGDSSLDNKAWIHKAIAEAPLGYKHVLKPARSVQDVCYWLNRREEKHRAGVVCINAAVEASTLRSRRSWLPGRSTLWPQEKVFAEHLAEGDLVAISCGCNDIAMAPTPLTALNLLLIARETPERIRNGKAWGLRHFESLFFDGLQRYIEDVLREAKARPRRVAICSIYFPAIDGSGWADRALGALKYSEHPEKVHLLLRTLHERAIKRVRVPGVETVHVPFYEALDFRDPTDYVARVEPSEKGGKKMAAALWRALVEPDAAS